MFSPGGETDATNVGKVARVAVVNTAPESDVSLPLSAFRSCALSLRDQLLVGNECIDIHTPRSGKSWLFLAFTFLPLFGPQVPVNGAGTVQFDNGRAIDADVYRANQVTAADLDGDGDQDILVCSYWGDFVKWYENEDGKGTFSDAADISTNSNGAG